MTVRLALIGAGWWATNAHLPAMQRNPDIELVAVCDPDPARAQVAAITFGAPRSFTDVGELLAEVALDGVVVATPHTTHRPIVERCLRAGVDVLVEKPMATTAQDAWDLVALARELGRNLSVGLTYQYAATARMVRRAIQEDIGDLVIVNGEFSAFTESLFATVDPSEANLDDPSKPHGTTYSDPSLSGGGQGQTQLTHVLGNILWNTGRQATEVFAYMDNRGLTVDLVDALTFRLEGGALGTTSSTGTNPEGAPIRHGVRYHGTHGMVEHDMLRADAWVYTSSGIRHIVNPEDRASYDRGEPVSAFARLIAGAGPNNAPADVAAASVALIEAAYRSAESSTPVAVTAGTIIPEEDRP